MYTLCFMIVYNAGIILINKALYMYGVSPTYPIKNTLNNKMLKKHDFHPRQANIIYKHVPNTVKYNYLGTIFLVIVLALENRL